MANEKSIFQVFLERLKYLMDDKELNQSTLARQVGISRSTITNWFSREQNLVSFDNLVALAKFFKCSSDFLIGLEDEFGNKNY